MKRVLLWIGVLFFGAYGGLMAWTAVAFLWVTTAAGTGGLGAVSAGVDPFVLLFWIAGITVNRMVAARARRAGGLARRLHKLHLALAFLFAATAIVTLGALATRGASLGSSWFLMGFIAAMAMFAAHFIVLAAVLALLARQGAPAVGSSA